MIPQEIETFWAEEEYKKIRESGERCINQLKQAIAKAEGEAHE